MDIPLITKYPYAIRIFQKKGDSYLVHRDVARRVQLKDGTTKLKLKRANKELPFPEFKHVYIEERTGRQMIDYYSPAENEFFPIEVEGDIEILKRHPIDKDVLLWNLMDFQRTQKKYAKDKDKWEKLLPIVLIGMMVAGSIGGVIFLYDGLVKVGATLNGISQASLTMMDKIDAICNGRTTVQPAAGTPGAPGFG